MAQNTHNRVLIVGGSSGVGLAVAELALKGHLPNPHVIISSSNKQKLEKAIEDVGTKSAGSKTNDGRAVKGIRTWSFASSAERE